MKQFKPFCENGLQHCVFVCVCVFGGDEGAQAASAETQSHREGRSERLEEREREGWRENEMCGSEIGL